MRCRNSVSRHGVLCLLRRHGFGGLSHRKARGAAEGRGRRGFGPRRPPAARRQPARRRWGRRPFPRQHGLGLGELLRAGQEAERRIVREALARPGELLRCGGRFPFPGFLDSAKILIDEIGDDAGQRAEVAVALQPARRLAVALDRGEDVDEIADGAGSVSPRATMEATRPYRPGNLDGIEIDSLRPQGVERRQGELGFAVASLWTLSRIDR